MTGVDAGPWFELDWEELNAFEIAATLSATVSASDSFLGRLGCDPVNHRNSWWRVMTIMNSAMNHSSPQPILRYSNRGRVGK